MFRPTWWGETRVYVAVAPYYDNVTFEVTFPWVLLFLSLAGGAVGGFLAARTHEERTTERTLVGVVAETVGDNRHLLWLAVVSLFASSAILWGSWRRNVAVFLAGLVTFVPLIVTVFCLLTLARLRGGSQLLSNAAGLVSLLMPGVPMLLVFLMKVRGSR